jgi:hypothetical protein
MNSNCIYSEPLVDDSEHNQILDLFLVLQNRHGQKIWAPIVRRMRCAQIQTSEGIAFWRYHSSTQLWISKYLKGLHQPENDAPNLWAEYWHGAVSCSAEAKESIVLGPSSSAPSLGLLSEMQAVERSRGSWTATRRSWPGVPGAELWDRSHPWHWWMRPAVSRVLALDDAYQWSTFPWPCIFGILVVGVC